VSRPVRPMALTLLTACLAYPGLALLFQGLYPFFAGESFVLGSRLDPWHAWAAALGIPFVAVPIAKALLGLLWTAGVLGLWAGDPRAWLPTLVAALLTLTHPWGGTVMAVVALICLFGFRENAEEVLA
jgi:hypothetical protein